MFFSQEPHRSSSMPTLFEALGALDLEEMQFDSLPSTPYTQMTHGTPNIHTPPEPAPVDVSLFELPESQRMRRPFVFQRSLPRYFLPDSAFRCKKIYQDLQADQDFLYLMRDIWQNKLEHLQKEHAMLTAIAQIPDEEVQELISEVPLDPPSSANDNVDDQSMLNNINEMWAQGHETGGQELQQQQQQQQQQDDVAYILAKLSDHH